MADAVKEAVGVIGVGRMELSLVPPLRRHGYAVTAYDIDPAQRAAAAAAGAQILDAPAQVGAAVRFVIIAVGYDDEVREVMLGKAGLLESLGAGAAVAVSSTCTPEHIRALAETARARGVDLFDAPICRGARAADEGTMLALVGGSVESFERALPIYRSFCANVAHLGDVGAGQFGKAINNYLLWVNGVALIEAGRLSEANGIDLARLREALLLSSGASDALKNWENVSFIWALKDMQIVMKLADQAGLALPLAGSIKELVKDGLRTKRGNPPDWMGSRQRSSQ